MKISLHVHSYVVCVGGSLIDTFLYLNFHIHIV